MHNKKCTYYESINSCKKMKTLEEELKVIGYSEEFVKVIASTSEMDCPNIDVEIDEYQTFEDVVISTNNVSATNCNTKTDFS